RWRHHPGANHRERQSSGLAPLGRRDGGTGRHPASAGPYVGKTDGTPAAVSAMVARTPIRQGPDAAPDGCQESTDVHLPLITAHLEDALYWFYTQLMAGDDRQGLSLALSPPHPALSRGERGKRSTG